MTAPEYNLNIMAKRKKNTKVVRKKKTKVVIKQVGPLEYEGWKVGDNCWFPVYWEVRSHQGKILTFHPDDSIEPAVNVMDITHGGYRVIPFRYIFDDSKKAKLFRSVEFAKDKK
jgi:hypothetical protein